MDRATKRRAQHPLAGGVPSSEKQRGAAPRRRRMEAILWMVGVFILVIAAVTMHTHTAPWPVELDFTKTLQGPHPIPCTAAWVHSSWVDATADFINRLNDPIQSV